ncbi:hypothetical protein D8I35_11455 [Corticibacter populi]|uniref:Uncharacterized protein n=1 Tax=Corticibacter populi TaxID=1550736 RepID=A0A3M6QRV2_9BURK|nr:hypothetical protein D8I35_11455 [Corticibacter populi]
MLTPWLEPAPHHRLPDHLYLLDPDGNWVMRLPPGIDLENAADIRQDLARLIQAEPLARRPGAATDIAE